MEVPTAVHCMPSPKSSCWGKGHESTLIREIINKNLLYIFVGRSFQHKSPFPAGGGRGKLGAQ